MLYLIGLLVLIIIVLGVIKFVRSGNKEFEGKLSLKEKNELEQILEKKTEDEVPEKEEKQVTKSAKPKTSFPSKDIKTEISRFANYVDINNPKVQLPIRTGIQNYLEMNFKVALEQFSLAISLNPQDPTGYYCRGLTKMKLKNYESAISDFTESINLKIKEPNAIYYRALSYYNLPDIDNAILNFKNYLNFVNNYPEAYFDLGLAYKKNEKNDDAINSFSQTIEKNPKHELAFFERGLIKHKLNDIEGACADFKKALELGYLPAYDYVNDICGGKNI
jgi:tetratricopeptide (TPR) repeat protein